MSGARKTRLRGLQLDECRFPVQECNQSIPLHSVDRLQFYFRVKNIRTETTSQLKLNNNTSSFVEPLANLDRCLKFSRLQIFKNLLRTWYITLHCYITLQNSETWNCCRTVKFDAICSMLIFRYERHIVCVEHSEKSGFRVMMSNRSDIGW